MSDWMDGEVEDVPDVSLTNGQMFAVLRMTEAMRDLTMLSSVFQIKNGIAQGDMLLANESWSELTETEQTALWVAPKFGGIFTTEERSIIKGGFKQ